MGLSGIFRSCRPCRFLKYLKISGVSQVYYYHVARDDTPSGAGFYFATVSRGDKARAVFGSRDVCGHFGVFRNDRYADGA